MAFIRDAYTHNAPAVAVHDHRLYVAFRNHDSDHIYLASTHDPTDPSSWHIVDVDEIVSPPVLSLDEPAQIRTSHGPALASTDNHLWLTFKGHDNSFIWRIALRELTAGVYELRRFGHLNHAGTAHGPAMAGPTMDPISFSGISRFPTVVYRGNRDDGVWVHSYMPNPDHDLRLPDTHTLLSPAAAYTELRSQEAHFIAYTDRATEQVMFMHNFRPGRPGMPAGWSHPEPVPYAFTSGKPALAVHEDILYLAIKSRDASDHQIWLGSWDDDLWTSHGSMPQMYTDQGPALVSFRDRLYVVFKGHNNSRIWYDEVSFESNRVEASSIGSGSYEIELGDAIYTLGNTSHGHAGLWIGIWGSVTGDTNTGTVHAELSRIDPGEPSGMPEAEGYVGYIEYDSSASSGDDSRDSSMPVGLMNGDDRKMVSWLEAFRRNSKGDLNDLAGGFFRNWVAHSMDSFKDRGYLGAAASDPSRVTGEDRRIVANAAYRVYCHQPGYCATNMIEPKGRRWNKQISDIKNLRCDGLVEVAWDYSGFLASCKSNLFGGGDSGWLLKVHNNFHAGGWTRNCTGSRDNVCFEMCPVIQGYCVDANDRHTYGTIGDSTYHWSDITNMRHGYHGIPYIRSRATITQYDNYLRLTIALADYGSDVLYVTVAGKYLDDRLELIVEGHYHDTDFDVEHEWFFKKVELPDILRNRRRNDNITALNIDCYGAAIGNRYRDIRDVRSYASFHILLVDASGNYQVYTIDNPLYVHTS